MSEFKEYKSKPITRMASQLTNNYEWTKIGEAEYMVAVKTVNTTSIIRFKAYEEPKVGDWVVRRTEDDIYHVTDAVFRERNIVP